MRTGRSTGDQAERVGDDVGDRPLEEGGVGLTEGHRLRHVDLGSVPVGGTLLSAAATMSSERDRRALQGEGATLQPAHVEQVRDHPVETVGGGIDGAQQLLPISRGPVHVVLLQARHGGLDGGERGPQIVGDRLQEGPAQRIGLGEVLGEGHLLAQRPALQRQPELVREGPQHLLVDRAELPAGEHQATVTGTVQVDRHPRARGRWCVRAAGGQRDPLLTRALEDGHALEPEAAAKLLDDRLEGIGGTDQGTGRARECSCLGPCPACVAGAPRSARPTSRLTRADTATSADSATRCSASAIVHVWMGGVKYQFSSKNAATAAASPTVRPPTPRRAPRPRGTGPGPSDSDRSSRTGEHHRQERQQP